MLNRYRIASIAIIKAFLYVIKTAFPKSCRTRGYDSRVQQCWFYREISIVPVSRAVSFAFVQPT